MAASLNIQQAYCDTTGTTVTLQINGMATNPLIPASGITGFTVDVNGSPVTINTATATNNYVTLTLNGGAIASGNTVLVSYVAASGNLTDSAGTPNTMPNITNFAVANNAGATT